MPALSRKPIAWIGLALAIGVAGCSELADQVAVKTHPAEFASPGSDVFHGDFVNETGNKSENCTTCHGEDLMGGSAGVSCFECHSTYPHPDDFRFPSQENFHGKTVAQEAAWDLSLCQSCHGADYSGNGVEDKNCLTCHRGPDGPENCTTCHGSRDANAAPPTGLMGVTGTDMPAVGAHQVHLTDSTISTIYLQACDNCHVTPATYDAPGHIDDIPAQAEIVFGALATHDGRLDPTYDFSSNTCSGTYCHGGFVFRLDESDNPRGYADSVIVGNNVTMTWTEVTGAPADCMSCHSIPPEGHIDAPADRCWTCHSAVVDQNLNIIDPSKHIDGKPNVFGNGAWPIPTE